LEIGSPVAGYPKWRSLGTIDWDNDVFGATLTGRYMSGLRELNDNNNPMPSIFYTDAQVRWNPTFMGLKNVGLSAGVNNIFDSHTPGCVSCDLANYAQTLYTTPGGFYYARVGVKY